MPVNHTAPQGGVLSGANPATFNSADPIVLFVIQVNSLIDMVLTQPTSLLFLFLTPLHKKATIIIVTCRLLAIPLAKLKQPRVIAEGTVGPPYIDLSCK